MFKKSKRHNLCEGLEWHSILRRYRSFVQLVIRNMRYMKTKSLRCQQTGCSPCGNASIPPGSSLIRPLRPVSFLLSSIISLLISRMFPIGLAMISATTDESFISYYL